MLEALDLRSLSCPFVLPQVSKKGLLKSCEVEHGSHNSFVS